MRIDQLLCYLRFARSRSLAQQLIDGGTLRCNGIRVLRHSHAVSAGDVLTFPRGKMVRIVEILALPERRQGAGTAHNFYRERDRQA